MHASRKLTGETIMANWDAATAVAGMAAVVGSVVAFVLNPINKRLDSHAKQLSRIGECNVQTAQTMARTVTLLDQVEKRVTRIEARDDAVG